MPMFRMRHLILGFSLVSLLASATPSTASPQAWLLDADGRAIKVDLVRNIVIDRALVGGPTRVEDLAVDPTRGYLFVPHGRGPFSVDVHDLKSLRRKAQLDFTVTDAPTDDGETIRFIFPSSGPTFFARLWNAPQAAGGVGVFEVATIDGTTLQTVSRHTVSPALEARLMVVPGSPQVYSLRSNNPARADVFDLPSLTWRTSINLK